MMPKVENTLLEAHYPRGAPLRCPECNAPIDLTTALLEDWGDPARRLGCPRCGLWLVRNARTHIKWRPLLGSVVVCLLLLLGVIVWALPVMDDVWPRSMALVFLIVAGIAAAARSSIEPASSSAPSATGLWHARTLADAPAGAPRPGRSRPCPSSIAVSAGVLR